MTDRQDTALAPAIDQSEIMAVYQQLGLTAAHDRAYYAAMTPQPTPTMHMTVRIGSSSLPPA
jgi:hypothetical protein